MPRQRTNYIRDTYDFPFGFPKHLERFQGEPGLSWAGIAHRLGTSPHTVGRRGEGTPEPASLAEGAPEQEDNQPVDR